MWPALKRLSLGVTLILAAAGLLLLSDSPQPNALGAKPAGAPTRLPRIAMFQMSSQPIIDEGARGVMEGLKELGFEPGTGFELSRFNAEGDIATANTIAREMVAGGYDLIITLTTGALQTTAQANRKTKVPHIFGLVADPVAAGVEIGTEPLDHPSHLVGIGTFPPVEETFKLARRLNPRLKRIGLAWNPGEINSEVCTKLARQICSKFELDLVEANVDGAAAVKEAVASLLDQRVDALFVGSDVAMLGSIEVVVQAARQAKIPVFTSIPGNARKGSLFDVGANYLEVGRSVGRVAGRVIKGESIAKIPVEMSLTNTEFVNMVTAKTLEPTWQVPVDVLQNAEAYVDETGEHRRSPGQPPAPTTSRAEPVPPDRSTDRPRSIDGSRRLTGNKHPARVVVASPTRELRP